MTFVFTGYILIQICYSALSPLTSWTLVLNPSMPYEFINGGFISGYDETQNKIYFLGPYGFNLTWSYSLTTNTFTPLAGLPFVLFTEAQAYTQIDRSIYFAVENTIREYDMSSNSIGSFNIAMKYNRTSPCMVYDGRYLMLLGGGAGNIAAIQWQIYDTLNSNFIADGTSLLIAKSRAACAISPDQQWLYVFGGTWDNESPVTKDNDDPSIHKTYIGDKNFNSAWLPLAVTLTANVYYSRAITVTDFIYIIGGRDLNHDPDAQVTLFDPAFDTVQITTSMQIDRSSPTVMLIGGSIYVFGFSNPLSWEYSNILTDAPTSAPISPTTSPSKHPSLSPTLNPSNSPSQNPSISPTLNPTFNPSLSPTKNPTLNPTKNPTKNPTLNPSGSPTLTTAKSAGVVATENTNQNSQNETVSGQAQNRERNDMDISMLILIFIGVIIILMCFILINVYRLCVRKKRKDEKMVGYDSQINSVIIAKSFSVEMEIVPEEGQMKTMKNDISNENIEESSSGTDADELYYDKATFVACIETNNGDTPITPAGAQLNENNILSSTVTSGYTDSCK